MYLYQEIAQQLAERIEQGLYGVGEKLPSIRSLREQYGVSIATIQQVYQTLERQGLIEARPKSGFYVKHLSLASPVEQVVDDAASLPINVAVNDEATRILQQCSKEGVIDLGVAFPAVEFLPVRQLQQISSRLIRQRMSDIMVAQFSPGVNALRQQISRRLRDSACAVSEDQIIITNGCQEALSLCLRAVAEPGDTIAIETPTFVGILQLIEALGMKALEIPTHPQNGISLDALAMALEQWPVKACALVASFNNPLGSNMPDNHRQQLVRLLSDKSIPLIEDDLFGDLYFGRKRPALLKSFDKQGLILYCSSISKSIAPGLRVGWVSPGRYQREIAHLKSFTSVGVSSIAQMTVAEFMESGGYERHLRHLRVQFARQVKIFSYEISRYFPRGTTITRPDGGYILWVGLPGGIKATEIQKEAIKRNIGVLPGHLFSASGKYTNFIRINCAISWNDSVQKAIHILADICNSLLQVVK